MWYILEMLLLIYVIITRGTTITVSFWKSAEDILFRRSNKDFRESSCRWWWDSCPSPSCSCSAGRLSSIWCVLDSLQNPQPSPSPILCLDCSTLPSCIWQICWWKHFFYYRELTRFTLICQVAWKGSDRCSVFLKNYR